jgi:beta-lactamase superfamily II metal-dependent hydrolase
VLVASLVVLAGCAPLADDTGQPAAAASVVGGRGSQAAGRAPATRSSPAAELQVHFLDVGQGDASVLVAPDATVLIDTGRHDSDEVVPQLKALGVSRIDVVAVTHAHADHVGQLDEVLAAFDVDEVWMSGTPSTSATFEEGLTAIEASEVAYEEPRAGDYTSVGSLEIDVLHPSQLVGDIHGDMLSMRVSYGAFSVLFTGDAEADVEAEMLGRDRATLASTIYQVGHHGSSTSTSPALMDAVSPEVAIYSAGQGNSYGHPHTEVLDRLTAAGVVVYGTDVNGTVTVASDGVGYTVSTATVDVPGAPQQADSPQSEPPASENDPGGCQPGQVDINTAGLEELDRIANVGPSLANQIVGLRPFSGLEDLVRVDGIGAAKMDEINEEALACAS